MILSNNCDVFSVSNSYASCTSETARYANYWDEFGHGVNRIASPMFMSVLDFFIRSYPSLLPLRVRHARATLLYK